MNLHAIAASVVSYVNPLVPATLTLSDGYSIDPITHHQVPEWQESVDVMVDLQPLTFSDVQKLDSINQSRVETAAYLSGQVTGLSRLASTGQAIISFADQVGIPPQVRGWEFTVQAVLEQWPEWCKVALARRGRA